jgi:LuxR family transcriptional regulator, maltose regulon positive regulatory protein
VPARSGSFGRPPAARGLVPRQLLFERLSAARPGEVILVCAPAGSGKTVLLRSWVESEGWADRVAWLSVDRGERDAQRFWLCVIDELAGVFGDAVLVERVDATPAFDGRAVVDRLLSSLHSLRQPVVLVIDDLHELRSEEALRLLELFLASLPPKVLAVLATRKDPRLGLHRLRLTGELAEIRGPDLRFSVDETRELLEATGITLSDESVALLHERTEGWAAGLRLAAISLAEHPEPERFVAEFSGSERTVAGYLLEEVLERQPPEVRDLLLRTSVVERVSGPLADALTGGTGSEEMLQGLEEANAFVTSIDVGRTWFRYHHLVSDLLQLELRRTSPALPEPLHSAAAQWFEEHGYVVDAVRQAQAARDWSHAIRLLADNYLSLVLDGRKATVRALLGAFPAGAAEEDAEFALVFASVRLYDGLLDESMAYLAVAERLAATVPDARKRLFALRLGSAKLWVACQRGELAAAHDGMRSLEALATGEPRRGDDHRASALMNLGIAELWSLHTEDARRDLDEALALARRRGRPYLEIGCLGHLALAAVLGGSPISDGLRLSEEAVTIAEKHGWGTHRILAPAVAAGAAALAWLGRLEEAEQWLDRVEPAHQRVEELETEPILRHARAALRLGQARLREALDEFRAAQRLEALLAPDHALPIDTRGWIVTTQILIGEIAPARSGLAAVDADEREGAGMRIAAGTLALAEGRHEDTVDVLAPVIAGLLEPVSEDPPRVLHPRWATVHALLLDAAARDRLGDPAAEASIERALELAEPDGVVLPFMLVPVRELLERHPRHRTAHATLLATILDVLAGSAPRQADETAPLQEELSEAELRVVRYMPSNLKAHEIAAELYVSTNTVRTHLRHIYAKLDAHNRGEAVARARSLGLLAPGVQQR